MSQNILLLISCLLGLIVTTTNCSAQSYEAPKVDYQQEMRVLIQEINSYAKNSNHEFEIIVNNGADLLVGEVEENKKATDLINNIDGLLLESYYYGWEMVDDAKTPTEVRVQLAEAVTLLKANKKAILSVDYCKKAANVNVSYSKNNSEGIVSFAANSRQLDRIPTYPKTPYSVNQNNVTQLQQGKNMLVLLNPQQYPNKASYLKALGNTDYDILIIDAYFNGILLTTKDVESLKNKKKGGTRLVVAYMSVGEAEDYRAYWQSDWSKKPPVWLSAQNPDWPGNYKVQYWNKEWKNILFGSPQAYLDSIISLGFDGVFLDVVDAYQYFIE